MDGKENEIANGSGATVQGQAQEGKPSETAAGEAGALQVTPKASTGAGSANAKPAAAPKPSRDLAVWYRRRIGWEIRGALSGRDVRIGRRG